eukprot:CAMPEP_0176447352 /NCGR_PEP_ID=MMETSP0127-20121128/24970_1 /TAXON_ID=938130 /ORGANISM="Platyophrya macrostoma, Strain WH" /LENGTH=57 /DNA_ID=CAMNT_0017833761 /DNA_START=6 /DNA_END=179 /DNA_ORIENTATION=+
MTRHKKMNPPGAGALDSLEPRVDTGGTAIPRGAALRPQRISPENGGQGGRKLPNCWW